MSFTSIKKHTCDLNHDIYNSTLKTKGKEVEAVYEIARRILALNKSKKNIELESSNIESIKRLNARELESGIAGSKTSWHEQYKESAWIFVGGLPYDLTEGDIICVFSQYGELVNINLIRDKGTGKSKGFCFICYEDQRSTVLTVDNLNGIKILGRTIRVDHVSEYKVPKEHENDTLEVKKLRSEGIAPKITISCESSEEEITEKEKFDTKDKKKKKKDSKKKITCNSSNTEEESYSNKKMKYGREFQNDTNKLNFTKGVRDILEEEKHKQRNREVSKDRTFYSKVSRLRERSSSRERDYDGRDKRDKTYRDRGSHALKGKEENSRERNPSSIKMKHFESTRPTNNYRKDSSHYKNRYGKERK